MGVSLFPLFTPDLPDVFFDYFNGRVLADFLDRWDEIAIHNGLVLISSFTDTREPPENFDGSPEMLIEAILPCVFVRGSVVSPKRSGRSFPGLRAMRQITILSCRMPSCLHSKIPVASHAKPAGYRSSSAWKMTLALLSVPSPAI